MSATLSDRRPTLGRGDDEPFDPEVFLSEPPAPRGRFRLSLALVGLVLTLGGTALKAEWTVADYASRISNLEEADKSVAKRFDALDADREKKATQADTDRRDRDDRRIRLANDLGLVNSRLNLLEMQTKWLNDWVKDNGLLTRRR